MRLFHIIVDGRLTKICPVYGTAEEVQHALSQETGRFVRVLERMQGGARGPKVETVEEGEEE